MSTIAEAIPAALPTTTRPRRGFRLRRRAHKIALTSHVLSSVGWFGIALGVALCGLAAARTADAGLTRALYRTMAVTPWVSIPTGLVAIGTGVLLSLGTIYGLVRYWWVAAKITIAAAIVPTDALLVARAAHNAAVSGSASHVLYGATIAHVVVLGVATVLSVFKPWGRTPMGRRR